MASRNRGGPFLSPTFKNKAPTPGHPTSPWDSTGLLFSPRLESHWLILPNNYMDWPKKEMCWAKGVPLPPGPQWPTAPPASVTSVPRPRRVHTYSTYVCEHRLLQEHAHKLLRGKRCLLKIITSKKQSQRRVLKRIYFRGSTSGKTWPLTAHYKRLCLGLLIFWIIICQFLWLRVLTEKQFKYINL